MLADMMTEARARVRAAEFLPLPGAVRSFASKRLLEDPFERQASFIERTGCVFIHVPKAAGTSLADALGTRVGHVPVRRFEAVDAERYASLRSFAFVRNPWTRMHSAYQYLKSSIGLNRSRDVLWATRYLSDVRDFPDFVARLDDAAYRRAVLAYIHFRPQMDWLDRPGQTEPAVDFIGRFESLGDDVERLSELVGFTIELPHLRKPHAGGLPFAWTLKMIDRVGELYARDVAVLGYQDAAPGRT